MSGAFDRGLLLFSREQTSRRTVVTTRRVYIITLSYPLISSLAKPRPTRNTVVLLPYLRPSKRSSAPARCAMHLLRLRSTALSLLIVAARALIVRYSGDAQEKALADRLRETQQEGHI